MPYNEESVMSHIEVKGENRQYTNQKTGEVKTFHNYTVVDLDDGNCIMIGQAEVPPGIIADARVITCDAVPFASSGPRKASRSAFA